MKQAAWLCDRLHNGLENVQRRLGAEEKMCFSWYYKEHCRGYGFSFQFICLSIYLSNFFMLWMKRGAKTILSFSVCGGVIAENLIILFRVFLLLTHLDNCHACYGTISRFAGMSAIPGIVFNGSQWYPEYSIITIGEEVLWL